MNKKGLCFWETHTGSPAGVPVMPHGTHKQRALSCWSIELLIDLSKTTTRDLATTSKLPPPHLVCESREHPAHQRQGLCPFPTIGKEHPHGKQAEQGEINRDDRSKIVCLCVCFKCEIISCIGRCVKDKSCTFSVTPVTTQMHCPPGQMSLAIPTAVITRANHKISSSKLISNSNPAIDDAIPTTRCLRGVFVEVLSLKGPGHGWVARAQTRTGRRLFLSVLMDTVLQVQECSQRDPFRPRGREAQLSSVICSTDATSSLVMKGK